MTTIRSAALAAAFSLLSSAALAAPSALQLVIGGEAYDGPPKFEVTFDGKVVGEGTVDAAIDTATVGRFADATDKSDYVESFSFPIPADVFNPNGDVRIRFLNEAYGGDGSNRDRNLYIASVAVNGRAVTVSDLTTQGASSAVRNETLGEFLVLRDGNEEGVSHPPDGGWPMPAAEAGTATPVPSATPQDEAGGEPPAAHVVAAADQTPPSTASRPVEAAQPATAAVAEASPEPEGTDATAAETTQLAAVEPGSDPAEATETAAADASASDSAGCRGDTLYNVVGFNENSNDLTPRLKSRLDQIIADIGEQRCRVQIVGYSSRQGAFDTNALFAIERAQNVLGYLRQNGVHFADVAATGGGETDRFGESLAANRRVVISVTP